MDGIRSSDGRNEGARMKDFFEFFDQAYIQPRTCGFCHRNFTVITHTPKFTGWRHKVGFCPFCGKAFAALTNEILEANGYELEATP